MCQHCSTLQPLPAGADYFAVMGLERKLTIDHEKLEKTFYRLSRMCHPDLYQRKSQREKELSLDLSSTLNTAYETLRDPFRRTEYLISLEGGRVDKEANKVLPELMEEIFSIQEDIEALKTAGQGGAQDALEEARQRVMQSKKHVEDSMNRLKERLTAHFSTWDGLMDASEKDQEALLTRKQDLVGQCEDILGQIRYLSTTLRDIDKAIGS